MSAVLDLPGLRAGVAAVRTSGGVLFHDAQRGQVFFVGGERSSKGAFAWLERNGLLAGAPVPKRRRRDSQIYLLRRDQAPDVGFTLWGDVRFSCVSCGESCRGMAIGPLLAADVDRLLEQDWSGTGRDPAAFFVDRDGNAASPEDLEARRDLFLHRADDACQFLRPDNRCEVHVRFGAEAKPNLCRAFPVQLRASPSGVIVGMRLGECSSAEVAGRGTPIAEQVGDLQVVYDEMEEVPVLPPQIWLSEECLLTWADYEALERRLFERPAADGVSFLLAALAAVEERAGLAPAGPADPSLLDALEEPPARERSPLPLARAPDLPIAAAALALEARLGQLAVFGKDAFQHSDAASGMAQLAIKAWLARRRAQGLAAAAGAEATTPAHLNQAWKEAAQAPLRRELAVRRVSPRAIAERLRLRTRI